MLNHLSNEPSRTNSCTIAQDPYPWKKSINIMQLRERMGYTSQIANCWVDQEWGMRMLIKIPKSPTKTHLRTISSQIQCKKKLNIQEDNQDWRNHANYNLYHVLLHTPLDVNCASMISSFKPQQEASTTPKPYHIANHGCKPLTRRSNS